MYIKFSNPKESGGNKGSSSNLMEYLSKENNDLKVLENNDFFNMDSDNIQTGEAILLMDESVKNGGLKKSDSKFYMFTINPSKAEIAHLMKITFDKEINSIDELNKEEKKEYHNILKEFTNERMERYAKMMNREVNGKLITAKDLTYIAKIEEQRHYDLNSKEVKHNVKTRLKIKELNELGKTDEAKKLESEFKRNSKGKIISSNMKKEGMQTHIHVVVSRLDKSKSTQMSPLATQRNSNNHQVNGNKCQIGFSRLDFALLAEIDFDKKFNYKREWKNSTVYQLQKERTQKNHNINLQSIRRVVNKEGTLDALAIIEIQAKAISQFGDSFISFDRPTTNESNSIAKDIINTFNPHEVAKTFGVNINPKDHIRNKINEVNPLAQIKSAIKDMIKGGGMDM